MPAVFPDYPAPVVRSTKTGRRRVADVGDAGSAVIDGEILVTAEDGTTDFAVLQNELRGKSIRIVLVAFDLPYLNGTSCGSCP
jgi:ATP-dependent DNA ligase